MLYIKNIDVLNKINYLIQNSIFIQFFVILFMVFFILVLIYINKLKVKDQEIIILNKNNKINSCYKNKIEGKLLLLFFNYNNNNIIF